MKEVKIFTEEQEKTIKIILAEVWTGRGKIVEDISKEINKNMFPLTGKQIKDVDNMVEMFVYGKGVQDKLSFSERLQSGFDYIVQKLLPA